MTRYNIYLPVILLFLIPVEGDLVRLVLPFTAGTVNFLALLVGVVVPLDLEAGTERLGILLGVPSSKMNIEKQQ